MWCDAADCCSTLEPQQGLRAGKRCFSSAQCPVPRPEEAMGICAGWAESAALRCRRP